MKKNLTLLLVTLGLVMAFTQCGDVKQKVLEKLVKETKTLLPMQTDDITTWTDIKVGDNSLIYIYVVDMDEVGIEVTQEDIERDIKPSVLQTIKRTKEMASLRQMGVTFIYQYSDKKGNKLGEFKVTEVDYK